MHDLYNNLGVQVAKSMGQATGTGDSSQFVDTFGFECAMFIILTSTVTTADATNYLAFTVEESNDNDFTDGTETLVPSDRVQGPQVLINDASMDNVVRKIGVACGLKRYLRLTWTETGTADATFAIVAVMGHPKSAPVL